MSATISISPAAFSPRSNSKSMGSAEVDGDSTSSSTCVGASSSSVSVADAATPVGAASGEKSSVSAGSSPSAGTRASPAAGTDRSNLKPSSTCGAGSNADSASRLDAPRSRPAASSAAGTEFPDSGTASDRSADVVSASVLMSKSSVWSSSSAEVSVLKVPSLGPAPVSGRVALPAAVPSARRPCSAEVVRGSLVSSSSMVVRVSGGEIVSSRSNSRMLPASGASADARSVCRSKASGPACSIDRPAACDPVSSAPGPCSLTSGVSPPVISSTSMCVAVASEGASPAGRVSRSPVLVRLERSIVSAAESVTSTKSGAAACESVSA